MRAIALTYSWTTSIADVGEYYSSFANDTGPGFVFICVALATLPNAGMLSVNQPTVQRLHYCTLLA
jgi:hypothetical protein